MPERDIQMPWPESKIKNNDIVVDFARVAFGQHAVQEREEGVPDREEHLHDWGKLGVRGSPEIEVDAERGEERRPED